MSNTTESNSKSQEVSNLPNLTHSHDADTVLDYLNMRFKKLGITLGKNLRGYGGDKSKGYILARLKGGASVDEMKQVVDLKFDDWSSDPDMRKFLRPQTLFGKEKFSDYVAKTEVRSSKIIKPSKKEEFIQTLSTYMKIYGSRPTPDVIDIYFRSVQYFDVGIIYEAMDKFCDNDHRKFKKFPLPSELRKSCYEVKDARRNVNKPKVYCPWCSYKTIHKQYLCKCGIIVNHDRLLEYPFDPDGFNRKNLRDSMLAYQSSVESGKIKSGRDYFDTNTRKDCLDKFGVKL